MDDGFEVRGSLGKAVGERGVEARYGIAAYAGGVQLSFHTDGVHAHVFIQSLPHLFNFYRDLGVSLSHLQPGLTYPLPDGDPSIVDAMKVIYEADQLRKGTK